MRRARRATKAPPARNKNVDVYHTRCYFTDRSVNHFSRFSGSGSIPFFGIFPRPIRRAPRSSRIRELAPPDRHHFATQGDVNDMRSLTQFFLAALLVLAAGVSPAFSQASSST